MKTIALKSAISFGLIILAMLLNFGCEQYDYVSPSPGILEIRFKTVSTGASTGITFNALNNFSLTIPEGSNTLVAIRNDDNYLPVYGDIKSIRRSESSFNVLQPAAEESTLVIGVAYAPPGNYKGVYLQATPGAIVTLDGYRTISVDDISSGSGDIYLYKDFSVVESKKTIVTVTLDLDKSMIKGAENYYYVPIYYISVTAQ